MSRRVEILQWLGLFLAPCAFAFEHVFNWGLSEAHCSVVNSQWGIASGTWIAAVTAVTALAAAGGLVAASAAYRTVRDTGNDDPPPLGRIWLLSICGILVSSLLLILILLSGSGALLLGHCSQS